MAYEYTSGLSRVVSHNHDIVPKTNSVVLQDMRTLRSAIFTQGLTSIHVKVLGTAVVMDGRRAIHVPTTYTDIGNVYVAVDGKTYEYILTTKGLDTEGIEIENFKEMSLSMDFVPEILCPEVVAIRYTNTHGHLYDHIFILDVIKSEQLLMNILQTHVNNVFGSVRQCNELIIEHNDSL